MKIFLDDVRLPPNGWTLCRWPEEVIALLKKGKVTHLSLDHDLGDAPAAVAEDRRERTGKDVLLFLEEQVFHTPDFPLPEIQFHTANPQGRTNMQAVLSSIERYKSS